MKITEYYASLNKAEKTKFIKQISKNCNLSISMANHFVYGRRHVTYLYCEEIAKITKGKVRWKDMHPNIKIK